MSYNIDTWRNKKIDNLSIPLDALHQYGWDDVRLDVKNDPTTVVAYGQSEDSIIEGDLVDKSVRVKTIRSRGVWSGNFQEDIRSLLRLSTGYLEATLVWEGGDTITKLIVDDGVVTEKEIDP